jgi:rare lipoprotein A
MRRPFYLLSLVALLFLSACAETELASHLVKRMGSEQDEGNFKVGNAYKVEGRWYQPRETYEYSETGIASWYGPGFQGKRTANGEKFDKNELTAAHRTLQMPSLVRVTNLDNGRSLVVRVNDRGPFKRGRIIDLSQRAAQLLGYANIGTAKVRLDLLGNESRAVADAARRGQNTQGMEVAINENGSIAPAPPQTGYQQISMDNTPAEPVVTGHVRNGTFLPNPVVGQTMVHPTSIYVQAGSFTNLANAQNLMNNLGGLGHAQVYQAVVNGRQFYRVRLGPIPNVDSADAVLGRVTAAGYRQAMIIVD